MLSRRGFLLGAAAVAAPAIIRPGILMPVRVIDPGHAHGVALHAMAHPIGITDPTHMHAHYSALTEDSLVGMERVWQTTGRGLVLRPRAIHLT